MLAAAIGLPLAARLFGIDRLGVLTLAWALLGSFGLLDFGLGRSLTQSVSAGLATGRRDRLPDEIVTSWTLLAVIGAACGLALASASSYIVADVLTLPEHLRHETLLALYALAAALPFMTLSSGLRGLLEAQQKFGLVNLVRSPLGVVTYLGPLLVVPFTRSVAAAVAVLAVARIAACVAYLALCLREWPQLGFRNLHWAAVADVARSGAWIALTNLGGTVLAYLDRLVLGSLATISTLAYYSTPQEIITRIAVVPMALAGVLFPAFSGAVAANDPHRRSLFDKMSTYTYVLLAPITLAGAAFAPELLGIWLGPSFAQASAGAVLWFCFGMLLNSVAVAPSSFLQAAGRADLTARIQLIELPVYVAALAWATSRFGLTGTAIVWAARIVVDCVLLFAASRRFVPAAADIYRRLALMLVAAVAAFGLLALAPGLGARAALFVVSMVALTALLPQLLSRDDREYALLAWHRLRSGAV